MRPLRYDLAGTTDANGNLTLSVPLQYTGEHRIVKVTMTTPTGGEWALLASGSLLTFGRGRRVTLGPEFLEPQDKLSVQLTGSVPSSAVSGTVSGMEGTFDEVLRQFSPQPNTIALDVNAPPILLVEAPSGLNSLSAPLTKALPVGAVSVGYVPVVALGGNINNVTAISIVGSQTGNVYFLDTANFPTVPVAVPLDPTDTSVVCNVQAAGARPAVDFLCWTTPMALDVVNRPQTPLTVTQLGTTPALWQVPQLSAVSNGDAFGNGVVITKVAGVPNQSIYVFEYFFFFDGANVSEFLMDDTTGVRIDVGFSNAAGAPCLRGNAGGRKMTTGAGLRYTQQSAAAAGNIWGHVHYTQA